MADQLVNEFTVNRPIDEAWGVITDVERIAPCLPGAQLQEIEGDIYRGIVKVKLGAITLSFKGQAKFIERDDATHRAVLKAEGRDTGGKRQRGRRDRGDARRASSPTTHQASRVTTDLHITGKVAQFGRGIMGDCQQEADGPVRQQPQHDARRRGHAPPALPAERCVPSGTTDRRPPASDGADRCAANRSRLRRRRVRKIDGPGSEPVDLAGDGRPGDPEAVAAAARRARACWCLLRRTAALTADSSMADRPTADRVRGAARTRAAGSRSRSSCAMRRGPGRDPQRPAARRRHPDADPVLARRPRSW